VQDLYTENYPTYWVKGLNKWKGIPCSWIQWFNNVNLVTTCKDFDGNPIKIIMGLLCKIDSVTLKLAWERSLRGLWGLYLFFLFLSWFIRWERFGLVQAPAMMCCPYQRPR
jgi:hypothetical protein